MSKTIEELCNSDVFDSRDVIERIEELEAVAVIDREPEDQDELDTLADFAEHASNYNNEWEYGMTFVRDDWFEDYAKELAEGIGAIDPNASWPLNRIDWEAAADDLKIDYSSYELRGETFWARD